MGASSQLAFYIKTGGELEWHEAKSYATSTDGLKVMLTGGWAVLASACLILAVAWFAQNVVFKAVGDFLMGIYLQVLSGMFNNTYRHCFSG